MRFGHGIPAVQMSMKPRGCFTANHPMGYVTRLQYPRFCLASCQSLYTLVREDRLEARGTPLSKGPARLTF